MATKPISSNDLDALVNETVEPLEVRKGPGRPPGAKNKPKPADKQPEYKERTDDDWRKDVANAWIGFFVIFGFIARLFGYQAEKLTEEEAMEDAMHLTPLVRKYPGIARIFSWLGVPIVILNRVSSKFKRKATANEKPEESQTGLHSISPARP